MDKKPSLNLVSLPELLKDRKWEDLSNEEKEEISVKILKAMFPESENKDEKQDNI